MSSSFLNPSFHHSSVPFFQLRSLASLCSIMNRELGLNLLVRAASEAVQKWSRDVKEMRMGILIVIHTFGSDLKWNPHIHLIVTGGGLSLDGKRWIETDRWKGQYLSLARNALNKPEPSGIEETNVTSWRERQCEYTGIDPLICPNCDQPLLFVGYFFGDWNELQFIFEKAGCDPSIPEILLRHG